MKAPLLPTSALLPVTSVLEFLERIGDKDDNLFRGQADASWRVDCSALRRHAVPPINADFFGPALVAYHAELLRGADVYFTHKAGFRPSGPS